MLCLSLGVFLSLLACTESLRLPSAAASTDDVAMFIGVFTSPEYIQRRMGVRHSWHVPGNVDYKFILCEDTNASTQIHTTEEEERFGDILRVPCAEGYTDGKLTRKLIATLRFFHDKFPGTALFFKTDDDTYPQIDQLLLTLNGSYAYQQHYSSKRIDQSRNVGHPNYLYAGYDDANPKVPTALHPVIRDRSSPWYEPEDIYPKDFYPRAMLGGPGYVLSASAVKFLLEQGIEDRAVPSFNEDKAVGIWIEQFPELKESTQFITIPSQDGYAKGTTTGAKMDLCKYMKGFGTWGTYRRNIVLHHKLSPAQMRCIGIKHASDSSDFACFCD